MRYILYISLLTLILQGCGDTSKEVVKELSFVSRIKQNKYTAGDPIKLQFDADAHSNTVLVVKNVFGTSVVKPIAENSKITFNLPTSFINRAGICNWKLIAAGKTYESGEIQIAPNSLNKTRLETYLGPRSITAGNTDYTMLVAIPTDVYDNPLDNETEVLIKHQFEQEMEENIINTNHLVAWKNVYAPEKSGRILITASCNSVASKELTSIVFPANATDFYIDFHRNHNYADGNQLITFSTTIIKDVFGNTISDGTLVSFSITDASGMLLQTKGTTLNGVAKAKLLHPAQKDSWNVTAYITGAAKSSTIAIDFESAVKAYDMLFSNENREVTIGPIQSFMGQLVPDGMPVRMRILDAENNVLETKVETSRDGLAGFTLPVDFFPNGSYTFKVEVAGITKTQKVDLR